MGEETSSHSQAQAVRRRGFFLTAYDIKMRHLTLMTEVFRERSLQFKLSIPIGLRSHTGKIQLA